MDPFKQSFLNGEEVDTEVYRFGKQGARVGMLSAGLYASNDNQVAVQFQEMVTFFRDETARELQKVAEGVLFDDEKACFAIYRKRGQLRFALSSPSPDRDKRTNLFAFDNSEPHNGIESLSRWCAAL
jgi:hypothetical protein